MKILLSKSLDYRFIGINIVAVWSASRHAPRWVAIVLWSSLLQFAVGLLLEDRHKRFESGAYAASMGLVITHIVSIRYYGTQHTH